MMGTRGAGSLRRPWTVLAAAGTAAHHGFELSQGVGLVLQPELGLRGAGALWGSQVSVWVAFSSARRPTLGQVARCVVRCGARRRFGAFPPLAVATQQPGDTGPDRGGGHPVIEGSRLQHDPARLVCRLRAVDLSRHLSARSKVGSRGIGHPATYASVGKAPLLLAGSTGRYKSRVVESGSPGSWRRGRHLVDAGGCRVTPVCRKPSRSRRGAPSAAIAPNIPGHSPTPLRLSPSEVRARQFQDAGRPHPVDDRHATGVVRGVG